MGDLFAELSESVVWNIVFVMYGGSLFFAITERSEMGLYNAPMFMYWFGFCIGMRFANLFGMIILHGTRSGSFFCFIFFPIELVLWFFFSRVIKPHSFICLHIFCHFC